MVEPHAGTVTILSSTGTKVMERERAFDIEQILGGSPLAIGRRSGIVAVQGPLFGFLGRMGLSQTQADRRPRGFPRLARPGHLPARQGALLDLAVRSPAISLDELTRQARRPEQATGDALPGSPGDPSRRAAGARPAAPAGPCARPAGGRSQRARCSHRELGLASRPDRNCTGGVEGAAAPGPLRLRTLLENDD
jgi:hypothetical protein